MADEALSASAFLLAAAWAGCALSIVLWSAAERARRRLERSLRTARADLADAGSRVEQRLVAALEQKVQERTAELTRAYEELKSLDAMKDSFLSSVAHEIRTPLASIRAFSEILLSYEAPDTSSREFIEIINKESERLGRLVNDILDLSKMEAGRSEWRLAWVDLGEAIRHSIETVSVLAREAGVEITRDDGPETPRVWGQSDRLVQVMTNLLGNAIKFTPPGGSIAVTTRVLDPGGGARRAEVMVRDTGVGIPVERLPSIFEKFKGGGDTLSGRSRGTGLGLAITREIVRRMGGEIRAESVEGAGTTLVFTLAAPERPAAVDGGDREPARSALTVGVADDDPALVEVLRESLVHRGCRVLRAGDGEAALDMARESSLDVLILDLEMPKISGWTVLEQLRRHPRTASLPVIVLTGWVAERDRARALALGAAEYLQKGQGLGRLCTEIEMITRNLATGGAAGRG